MFDPSLPFDPSGDVIRHYVTRASDAEYVSLKHYDIKSLEPLMNGLAEMKSMRTLCLSDNLLTSLPEDMSALSSLETLDVSRNPFPNATSVLRGLVSLPKLKHLLITISEDDEEELVAGLLQLQTINGVSLEFEARRAGSVNHNEPTSMLNALRVGASVEAPRGYGALRHFDPKEALKFQRWCLQDVEDMAAVQNLVKKVSVDLSNPKEYLDYVTLVESHVLARTRSESDIIKSAIVKWNAKCLLLEYSFDELVRSSAKYGSEVVDAVQAVFSKHLSLFSEVSTILGCIQDDRDAKVEALQEDLAKELLTKERLAAERIATATTDARAAATKHPHAFSDDFFTDSGIVNTPLAALPKPNQPMTLANLRSLIKSLFNSKRDHDRANSTANLPVETIEQHLFTFFYERSSSEDEIRVGASSFMSAVRHYAKTEIDIELFLLIVQCEVDEPFWHTFGEQQDFLFDVIQDVTAGRSSRSDPGFANERDVEEILRIISRNWSIPSEDEIHYAIHRGMKRNAHEVDELHISTSSLATIILRHSVGKYRLSIKPIVTKFHALDPEKSGVISVAKFRQLLRSLLPQLTVSNSQAIIGEVDIHNNDVVNFSDVVHCILQHNRLVSAPASGVSSPRAPRSVASAR
jgi:hypothetical protein